MAAIDPDGLFNGERLASCSDLARLYWPYFYAASNGYARIEISYDRFISRALHSFKLKLTKEQFFGLIREYRDNYLLFLYKSQNTLWGQWVTDSKYLPRHKTAKDNESPEPPIDAYAEFLKAYELAKTDVPADLENFGTFPKSSEERRTFTRGSGIGGGTGNGSGEGEGDGFPRDHSDDVCEIAYAHPRNSHLREFRRGIPRVQQDAILHAIIRDGRDLVLAGTKNLADKVAEWPPGEKKYAPEPVKFYTEFEYLKDPVEWQRSGAGDGKQKQSAGDRFSAALRKPHAVNGKQLEKS
jgi:hypothetical protein